MPTYYARKAGNINATDVWATTPTGTAADFFPSFTSADTLVLNNFTIGVPVGFTVGEVRADTTGGATAGGSLFVSTGGVAIAINANINNTGGTANGLVQSAAGSVCTLTGNVTAGAGVAGLRWNGTITVVGSVTAASTGNGITCDNVGTYNITGAVTGGASTGYGIHINQSGATVNVTGTVTGGAGGAGISNNAAATLNVTGAVNAGSGAAGVTSSSNGATSIVGTCTGNTVAGATVTSTGTLTATRAKGGPNANSAVGISNGTAGSIVNVSEIEFGDLGASPVSGPCRLTDSPTNVAIMYRFGTTKKTLVDANASGLMPAASNVRSGTVYNGGNSTGTCAVPAAGSVALGVPVDNTTGTAALTPAAVWDYLTANATTAGSMGERLRNAATVASTGQQLADALTP